MAKAKRTMAAGKWSATMLQTLIKHRHGEDAVVVTECKDGATTAGDGRHRRLDAWALKKTWSPPTCIGYEIKVSRSDWLNDEKFAAYLELCHLLYLVAPAGVLFKEELPATVGWLEPIGEGDSARLVLRKKAVRREIAWPGDLMAYVLMSRTHVIPPNTSARDHRPTKAENAEYWQEFVDGKREWANVGWKVRGRMKAILDDALARTKAAEQRAKDLEACARVLKELGIDRVYSESGLRDQLTKMVHGDHGGVCSHIEMLQRNLTFHLNEIRKCVPQPKTGEVA